MNIAIDIILALIAVITVLRCTVRGFVRSFFGSLKLVFAATVSFALTPIIFGFFDKTAGAIAYVVIFVLAYIGAIIAVSLMDRLFKLPVLNFANKALGIALGVVSAYVILSVASAVLTLLLGFFSEPLLSQSAEAFCESTYVYRFFCNFGAFSLIG